MNNEESRLRTFSTWPTDAAVDPTRIAKAGFFYTGQGLEVQCFSCGGKISEWNYGDQVMAKHRRLDPLCPFVINPSTSGNVPKINLASTSNNVSSGPSTTNNFRTESSRLDTYTNWPVNEIVTPQCLAEAGFYSLQEGDKVKCAYCQGIAGFWVPGDDPKTEHKRHFPYCSFVLANFNADAVEMQSEQSVNLNNTKLICGDNLQELGIQAHKGPRQPRYATFESRLRTFTNWSVDLIQTPDMLAEAGFYYVGTGDQVRCFYCDGGLRHWDPDDEPWVEHAKWFPACSYVRLIKGAEFIEACDPMQLAHNNLVPIISPAHNGRPTQSREISDQEIQVFMNSPPALAALGIGLPVCRVKQAIRQNVQQTGLNFSSADALIEAALNLQLDDTETQDTGIQQEVSNFLNSVLRQENIRKENSSSTPVAEKSDSNKVANSTVSTSKDKNLLPKLSLEEENRQLKEARLCKICMDNEVGVVFLPCGHLATCVNCAPILTDCPVCRSVIKGTVRTFLS